MSSSSSPSIAVIGGEPNRIRAAVDDLAVAVFGSSRHRGTRRLMSVAAAIRGGRYRGVILRVRWLGHSDYRAIRAACTASGVPLELVQGSPTEVRAAVQRLLVGERHVG